MDVNGICLIGPSEYSTKVGKIMRNEIIKRLNEDLLGPYETEEILSARPSDTYLTGILWPIKTAFSAADDERLGLSGLQNEDQEGNSADEEIRLVGTSKPCSAGISFAVRSSTSPSIEVDITFGIYLKNAHGWVRRPKHFKLTNVPLEASSSSHDLIGEEVPVGVQLHIRTAKFEDFLLVTTTLINQSEHSADGSNEDFDKQNLFQTSIVVSPSPNTELVPRVSRGSNGDDEDISADLIYRDSFDYVTGHTCAGDYELAEDQLTVASVSTIWIPVTRVQGTSPLGHQVFEQLHEEGDIQPLSVKWLSEANSEDCRSALQKLVDAYGLWLETQESRLPGIPDHLREQALKNIEECRTIHSRMSAGVVGITKDPVIHECFRLANSAMNLQYQWNARGNSASALHWRPFQLGFFLLAGMSVVENEHPDREIMDLLWFPTGGGKTEAYLALIAFLAFYRRLSHAENPDDGAGVAAVMRYTLRLLTTQQFMRAAALILACEAIRRQNDNKPDARMRLGTTPFSIGLWVGSDAVPNRIDEAAAALRGTPDQPSPRQLLDCPSCGSSLNWNHAPREKSIHVRCPNGACILHDSSQPLPVWTVDEDIYAKSPTLLIGTIDKFAQIVRRKEVNRLFGISSGNPPDLILQDELHLISGPLGTVAGIYEVAIDELFSKNGFPPKIIGSTATIKRASHQVRALFDRSTAQFPPSCIDASDSAFAITDANLPGRTYVGLSTVGRSAKFTLQAVAASLLQSAFGLFQKAGNELDPYWTLVSYFNSLRELGGALVLMQDDVGDAISTIAKRRGEQPRLPRFIEELTSRRNQSEIRDMLDLLAYRAGEDSALDVVLATNMLSVGVDIPRLGLMLMNGQPKGRAEYIQATSRVGRGTVGGLVVSVLNNAKARDRSHYESFCTWHQTLYRDVEPTSVTPFAPRARDRALHTTIVTLTRHLIPEMLEQPEIKPERIEFIQALLDRIVDRARRVDPEETEVRAELEGFLSKWQLLQPIVYWNRWSKNSLLQDAERVAALKAMGRLPGSATPTMNNMRSVEASTKFRLKEFIKPDSN